MARSGLRLTVEGAAKALGVSSAMVRKLENGNWSAGVTTGLIERVQSAYEARGVIFEPRDDLPPGVRCPEQP